MFICDKCKKPITAQKKFANDEWEAEIHVSVNGKRFNLCDDCYADLRELRDKAMAEFFSEGDEDGRETNVCEDDY